MALDKLVQNRTTVVIAHRLSTIKNSDEIIVIGKKGIIERGTHSQLIALGGYYATLQRDIDVIIE
jgi:ATP-binding cassette subfamily B protein